MKKLNSIYARFAYLAITIVALAAAAGGPSNWG